MRLSEAIKRLEQLKKLSGNLRMGNCGYYGEFYEMDGDFAFSRREVDHEGASDKQIPKEIVVHVCVEDVGPEPD